MKDPLSITHPQLVAQWHPRENGDLTPDQVVAGSHKKVWWICPNSYDHEWDASIVNRVNGRGCPFCRGLRPSITNSLASLYPDIATQWHPLKNGTLTPEQVVAGSAKKAWWKCPNGLDHEWDASIRSRVRGNGCPCCSSYKASVSNSLANLYPVIAAQWHPTKNGTLTTEQVVAGSTKKAWWKCPKIPDHEWNASVRSRVRLGAGCPACNSGWTVENIRRFIGSLINHVETFTPAELYLLFQQSGLLQSTGKGIGFVKALTTGRFPKEEIEKFVNGKPSTVDKFLQDNSGTRQETSRQLVRHRCRQDS